MVECIICKRTEQEIELHKGIYEDEITDICEKCAGLEAVPLIKKPTQEQLQKADRKYSVRERMEEISGMSKKKPLSMSQMTASKNLKDLKFPEKKQEHESLVSNYYWVVQMARRRKKLSLSQLSERIFIPVEVLGAIEYGQLPENFSSTIKILENALDVKLFKEQPKQVNFIIPDKTPEKKEHELIEQTKQKMQDLEKMPHELYQEKQEGKPGPSKGSPTGEEQPEKSSEIKKDVIKNIASGKFDFSKRKNLDHVTINDLIDMKKQKQKKEMLGDDLDLEIDEV